MESTRKIVTKDAAPMVIRWIKEGRGVAQWRSVDLSDPGASCLTPARDQDGTSTPEPHWKYDSKPEKVYERMEEFEVMEHKEVRRFHVAVRRGSNRMRYVLTDASTRKVNNAVERAGQYAYYQFDYMTQEVVIYAPTGRMPMEQFAAQA